MGCDLNGDGNKDVSCEPGSIDKNGKGQAIVAISNGIYTLKMDGDGNMFLYGIQDFRNVTGSKNGKGSLIWVPSDPNKICFGPIIKNGDGSGEIRVGSIKELNTARGL